MCRILRQTIHQSLSRERSRLLQFAMRVFTFNAEASKRTRRRCPNTWQSTHRWLRSISADIYSRRSICACGPIRKHLPHTIVIAVVMSWICMLCHLLGWLHSYGCKLFGDYLISVQQRFQQMELIENARAVALDLSFDLRSRLVYLTLGILDSI